MSSRLPPQPTDLLDSSSWCNKSLPAATGLELEDPGKCGPFPPLKSIPRAPWSREMFAPRCYYGSREGVGSCLSCSG